MDCTSERLILQEVAARSAWRSALWLTWLWASTAWVQSGAVPNAVRLWHDRKVLRPDVYSPSQGQNWSQHRGLPRSLAGVATRLCARWCAALAPMLVPCVSTTSWACSAHVVDPGGCVATEGTYVYYDHEGHDGHHPLLERPSVRSAVVDR